MRWSLVLAGLLMLPLSGASKDMLEVRVAGKPQQCIDTFQAGSPTIVGKRTILYQSTGKTIWKVEPVGHCTTLRTFSTLIVQVYGGQICRNDRFQVLEPGQIIASAPCRFGSFTPYERPATGNAVPAGK